MFRVISMFYSMYVYIYYMVYHLYLNRLKQGLQQSELPELKPGLSEWKSLKRSSKRYTAFGLVQIMP